jgi:hypothetical protein
MNQVDPNFDQLRRLLRLKRYEQPPPRYFTAFSFQVVARLKAGQDSGLANDNWWQRVWNAFELRPVLPAAFGAAIGGLLVVGALYTENVDVPPELLSSGATGIGPTPVALPYSPDHALAAFSTNPVPATGSLFDQIRPGGNRPPMRAAHPLFK